MRIDPLRAAVAAACCLAAGSVTAASGQTGPKPVPGCDGVHLVDKAKDTATTSTDITNVWFDRVGGKTFANLQVTDLKTELPADSVEWYWTLEYGSPDGDFLLQAYLKADGTQGFGFRKAVSAPTGQGAYGPVEDATGTIFPGKPGVIQWELTDALGGKVGNQLTDAFAAGDEVVAGAPEQGSPYLRATASIDDTEGVTARPYTVKDGACEPPPAGETTPPPAPPSSPPAPAAPPSQPAAPASPAGQRTEKLDITVSKKVPRARKVRRSLALSVSSKGGVSGVDAVLYSPGKKGKVVGRGKLSSLKGKGKLKLKISKKLKKGTYTLQLVGRNANGNGGAATVKLRLK